MVEVRLFGLPSTSIRPRLAPIQTQTMCWLAASSWLTDSYPQLLLLLLLQLLLAKLWQLAYFLAKVSSSGGLSGGLRWGFDLPTSRRRHYITIYIIIANAAYVVVVDDATGLYCVRTLVEFSFGVINYCSNCVRYYYLWLWYYKAPLINNYKEIMAQLLLVY